MEEFASYGCLFGRQEGDLGGTPRSTSKGNINSSVGTLVDDSLEVPEVSSFQV